MPDLDWIQWPAMVVTIVAAWSTASERQGAREFGFWAFLLSNVLWVAWGWQAGAWALIVLQVGLAAMNVRGIHNNDPDEAQPEDPTAAA